MFNSTIKNLFGLIKSLTKSEKRTFRLYASRNSDGADTQYMRLFDILEKAKVLNEKAVKNKMGTMSTAQYSNLKSHLYDQILISLRQTLKDRRPNIKIREQIDFAHVLYGKGLHIQALSVLNKAKKLAKRNYTDFSLLTIIELEKLIQSRHITRSSNDPIYELIQDSEYLGGQIANRIRLSNIRLELHNKYIREGHITNKEEADRLSHLFVKYMGEVVEDDLSEMELVYFYQSYVWYYYILNDFNSCLVFAKKWVTLFQTTPELVKRDVDLYMRGFHYVLTSAYNIKDTHSFSLYLKELERIRNENYSKFNHNSQILSFLYVHSGRMNEIFLNADFEKGLDLIPKTLNRLSRYRSKLDSHKIMIIYYKVAWMYYGASKLDEALNYLNKLLALEDSSLREDIICYAGIMRLMVLYDMEDLDAFENENQKLIVYMRSMSVVNVVQRKMVECLSAMFQAPVLERKSIIKDYREQFKLLKVHDYEQKTFNYLEVDSWLESKLHNVSLSEACKITSGN